MSVLAFFAQALFISLSGVMAPGPMTAVAVGRGSQSPHAGAWVAVGHGAIEFPLMVAIFYGFGHLIDIPHVKETIGVVGGMFLLLMAVSMFRSMKVPEVKSDSHTGSSVLAGMILSFSNPYFIIWWATVGAALILQSTAFGLLWFVTFAVLHWSCDFFWCYFLSFLSFRGKRSFGRQFQRFVFGGCGVFLLFIGGKFILDALR
jgi:threonine/homoserine/homoserine lactone efflux protein